MLYFCRMIWNKGDFSHFHLILNRKLKNVISQPTQLKVYTIKTIEYFSAGTLMIMNFHFCLYIEFMSSSLLGLSLSHHMFSRDSYKWDY